MRLRRFLAHGVVAIAVAAVMVPLASAQRYRILHADYGVGRRRVDVTQRLREVARADASFPVGNDIFAVDPAPGMVKTLRIFASGPGDQTQLFEYREHDVVDGGRFSGWREGNWGGPAGQYLVLRAFYGIPGRNADVTQRLRELARRDTFFRMENGTFGIDPAPGVVKTLRIIARGPDGQERTFEYPEHGVVDGAIFSGWSGGRWGDERWDGDWDGRRR